MAAFLLSLGLLKPSCLLLLPMKRSILLLLSLSALYINTSAQVKDTTELNEVVISGIQNSTITNTSLIITPYTLKQLENSIPYNLSDAMANIPGISQMTTGNAISKPVIRGLYGNRVLVLLSGLRFDNQQFQDEHGLGLSQIGISKIEVIKGPASLLYGSDAVGGVINIIETTPKLQGVYIDATTRLYANTGGTLTDVGLSKRNNNKWWRLRVGAETHADYTDGRGNRVLNSRNGGYYAKAGIGFTKGNWTQNNAYNFSYNRYGFIIADLGSFFSPDARWSRAMTGPHHNVLLNTLSSQNTFTLKSSTLYLNAGVQSNKRSEDEGGGSISLDMHLLSLLENLKWEKQLTKKLLFVANQQFTYENNTNLGKRILVPDANMLEWNSSGFFRYSASKVILEAGIGLGYKYIKTLETGSLNQPGEQIQPFTYQKPATNGMMGVSYNPSRVINIKGNFATGFRAANLAELSSNGIHEGTYRYEVGNPNLNVEQNINADVQLNITKRQYQIHLSAYYNRFNNYIYLMPTNESYYGFQIYRYMQQGARIYGYEANLEYNITRELSLSESFSTTDGILDNGDYLPFIPAYKSVSKLMFNRSRQGRSITYIYISPEAEYNFAQNKTAQFETQTPDYLLLNLNLGITTSHNGQQIKWSLSCKNLLDKQYVNHLSRLKYYGLNNQGINFIVSVSTNLKVK